MIDSLRGRIAAVDEESLVLIVGGFGVRVLVPARTAQELALLAAGGERAPEIQLSTHLLVRPDGWQLYGFMEEETRRFFRMLIGLPGVGPRTAAALLSHLTPEVIREAVAGRDAARFETVPGVGKRLAARIVSELAGRIQAPAGVAVVMPAGPLSDAVDALAALGLPRAEALSLARAVVSRADAPPDSAAIVAAALRLRRL